MRADEGGRIDISHARGLVHLRRGLVEDANFAWDHSPPPLRPTGGVAIAFFEGSAAADSVTVVVLRLGEDGGWLEVVGRPGSLRLGRIATGLRTWIADVAPDGPEPGGS